MDELDSMLEFLRRKVRDAEQSSYVADMEMRDVHGDNIQEDRNATWKVAWQGGRLSALGIALDQIKVLVGMRDNRRAAIERMEGERT